MKLGNRLPLLIMEILFLNKQAIHFLNGYGNYLPTKYIKAKLVNETGLVLKSCSLRPEGLVLTRPEASLVYTPPAYIEADSHKLVSKLPFI